MKHSALDISLLNMYIYIYVYMQKSGFVTYKYWQKMGTNTCADTGFYHSG